MKKFLYFLVLSLPFFFASCQKNELPPSYDASKIAITVTEFDATSATIVLAAQDVKGLGVFTIGLCFSTSPQPTISNTHFDLLVNADSLPGANLNLQCYVSSLEKGTTYYVKGYIIKDADTFYSQQKSFQTSGNTLTITTSNDYVPAGHEYWIVLSNNSTTLLTQKLQNSQTYTFSDNIPDLADFHIFHFYTNLTQNYLLVETYADIVPDNFFLDKPYQSTVMGQATVTVSDLANYLSWGIASSWWWNMSSVNNSLTTNLSTNPDDLFIHYLPANGTAPMCKFVTGVTPSTVLTYTMADFTPLTDFKEIVLPANTNFSYNLAGFNSDYYDEFLRYHGYSYSAGYPGTFKLYYPPSITTNFYFYAFYNTSTQQSFYNKVGTLPTSFFSAFPTITIENSSQFTTVTSSINNYSNYEIMDFCGMYSAGDLHVQWDYYRQPQASNSVQIPEFPTEVKQKINDLFVSNLSFSDVGYFDILNSDVDSYTSYVDLLIKQSNRFYDVVKERRHYYQWVNKKSVDEKIKNYNLTDR
jgi:hypothetical protein